MNNVGLHNIRTTISVESPTTVDDGRHVGIYHKLLTIPPAGLDSKTSNYGTTHSNHHWRLLRNWPSTDQTPSLIRLDSSHSRH
jgi:hypothetical protein